MHTSLSYALVSDQINSMFGLMHWKTTWTVVFNQKRNLVLLDSRRLVVNQ